MHVDSHTARDFTDAMIALLPPGKAWEWPHGGFGDSLLLATAQELARIDAEASALLDYAIELHRPAPIGTTINDYRAAVNKAFPGLVTSGGIVLNHLLRSAVVGSHVGDSLWSDHRIFYIHVRYDSVVVDQAALNAYLMSIKQAHISLFFEDIG